MADIPVVVLFGATASGKTALLKSLFASSDFRLPAAEVISADSMQVYRGMDIGTAKPPVDLQEALPHHLIDIRNPDEPFCAGDFVREAELCCAQIHARKKLIVISGGTGFYIRNFVCGLPQTPQSNPQTRAGLLQRLKAEGLAALYAELQRVDPARAAALNPNDGYRILRALEVYADSGKPLSSFSFLGKPREGYRFLILSLERERAELYKRINARCAEMFATGLEAEVARLVQAGFAADAPGMRAIGYREFFAQEAWLKKLKEGEPLAADEAAAVMGNIAKDSRRYAKRQETYIRALPAVIRIEASEGREAALPEKVAYIIEDFCKE